MQESMNISTPVAESLLQESLNIHTSLLSIDPPHLTVPPQTVSFGLERSYLDKVYTETEAVHFFFGDAVASPPLSPMHPQLLAGSKEEYTTNRAFLDFGLDVPEFKGFDIESSQINSFKRNPRNESEITLTNSISSLEQNKLEDCLSVDTDKPSLNTSQSHGNLQQPSCAKSIKSQSDGNLQQLSYISNLSIVLSAQNMRRSHTLSPELDLINESKKQFKFSQPSFGFKRRFSLKTIAPEQLPTATHTSPKSKIILNSSTTETGPINVQWAPFSYPRRLGSLTIRNIPDPILELNPIVTYTSPRKDSHVPRRSNSLPKLINYTHYDPIAKAAHDYKNSKGSQIFRMFKKFANTKF